MNRNQFLQTFKKAVRQYGETWILENDRAIRCINISINKINQCPIAYVATFKTGDEYSCDDFMAAGAAIGLSTEDIDDIVTAADADFSGLELFELERVRDIRVELLTICKMLSKEAQIQRKEARHVLGV